MFIIVFVFIAYTFVELAITSTTKHTNFMIPSFENTFTYCDPEYYTALFLGVTLNAAGKKCASKCSQLHGYINSNGELVCYREQTKALRISRFFGISKNECFCGQKTGDKDKRQLCYPPFELVTDECETECGYYTLLRGKKLTNNTLDVMWCGKEWNEDNVIEELDFAVKHVGQVEYVAKRSTYRCFCGSKAIKAKTFISKETSKKMERLIISHNAEGVDLDKFGATCSFGKFWIKKDLKYKCPSICTTKRAFILLHSRELICYSDIVPAIRVAVESNENICLCGGMFGKGLTKIQECTPAIREEKTDDVSNLFFQISCKETCENHKAYVECNAEMNELVFCESSINPSSKISVDLRLEHKLGEISKDNQLIECECGLTELSLIKIKNENRNETASLSHNANKNVNTNVTANLFLPGTRAFQGIVNDSKITGENGRSSSQMNCSTNLSPSINRDENTHRIGSSSQAESLEQIATHSSTLNRDGIKSHIPASYQTEPQIRMRNSIATSPQTENQIRMENLIASSPQTNHKIGMGNRIAISPQTEHQVGMGNRIATSPQTEHQVGMGNRIAISPQTEHQVGMGNRIATSPQTEHQVGMGNRIAISPQTEHQVGMGNRIATSSQTEHQMGIGNSIVTPPQIEHQMGMENHATTSAPRVVSHTTRSSQNGSRIQIGSSPGGGMTKKVTSFSQLISFCENPNEVTNLPRVERINVRSSETESLKQIENSRAPLNRDGMPSHDATSSETGHRIGESHRTSPQVANRSNLFPKKGSSIQIGSSARNMVNSRGMTNQMKSVPHSIIRVDNPNQITNLAHMGNINVRSTQTGTSNRIGNLNPKVGITSHISTSSQVENRFGFTNPTSPPPRAVSRSGISEKGSSNQNAISTDRSDPNRKGNPLTFNRRSSLCNATNPIENANQIASSHHTISNRSGRGNLSNIGSSRNINHGVGSSSELNDGDNFTFGENILKNASFLDQLRYDYQALDENALSRIPPHNSQLTPVGFNIIPSNNSRTANSHSTVNRVGITSLNSTSSQAEVRLGFANPISSSPRAVSSRGITQKGISTNRLDPSRNGKPVTFNRWSSSCNATNPINNLNQIASSSQIYNRNEGGNLSTGSSHKKINHGAGSSRELNDSDNYIFGEILKNASFLDKPRYDYQELDENELSRIPPHNSQSTPVGFNIIPSNNSQCKIKANSELPRASSANMRDSASLKNKNRDEDEMFGEMLDDVPFLNSLAGYHHPVTIDAPRSFSPVGDYYPTFPIDSWEKQCRKHGRSSDDLPGEFILPDSNDFRTFPPQDIIPFNYGSERCSSSFANNTASFRSKRMKN